MKSTKHTSNRFFYWLEFPIRYLFGRDIFISYSRKDTFDYPENLISALQEKVAQEVLRKKMPQTEISFYLDKWNAPPDGELPASLIRHLRWSSIMVVICTERAVNSPSVRNEVEIFPSHGRKVILLNVDQALSKIDFRQSPWHRVSGSAPLNESYDAVGSSKPSDHVVERILESIKITTQDKRLRRSVWGTLGMVILLLALAAVFSNAVVQKAQAEANARVHEANEEVKTATTEAARITDEAEKRVADAKAKEDYALGNAVRATKLALRATTAANEQRRRANQASELAQIKTREGKD